MEWRLQTVQKDRTAAAKTFWRRRSTHNGVQTNQWAVNVGAGVFARPWCVPRYDAFEKKKSNKKRNVSRRWHAHKHTHTYVRRQYIQRNVYRQDRWGYVICLSGVVDVCEKTPRRPSDGGSITMVLFDTRHRRVTEESPKRAKGPIMHTNRYINRLALRLSVFQHSIFIPLCGIAVVVGW